MLTVLTRTAAAAALVLALAGCSSDDTDSGPDAAPSSGPRTLKDTCLEVEVAIRDLDAISPQRRIDAVREKLERLSQDGDAETRDALVEVVEGLAEVRRDAGRRELIATFGAWADAVGDLGDRCAAAGSSALQ